MWPVWPIPQWKQSMMGNRPPGTCTDTYRYFLGITLKDNNAPKNENGHPCDVPNP